jgi:ribonuclease I
MRTVGLIENQIENWLENQWISNTHPTLLISCKKNIERIKPCLTNLRICIEQIGNKPIPMLAHSSFLLNLWFEF